jgi:transcriptional regulator with XRE-family HTH domain/quercetin dioxygenase-like cupin family protein
MAAPAFPPIGGRLREARQRKQLTVRGLARAVDVSPSMISQIETGKSSPSVSTLYAITAALGISIEDVFGDPDRPSGGDSTVEDRHAAPEPAASAARVVGEASGAETPNSGPVDRSSDSAVSQGLRLLAQSRRVGPAVHPEDREVLQLDSGVTWELLGKLPDTHVEFLRITYEPGGSSSGAGVLMRHQGTEYGYVLSGSLTLTLAFETYVLEPGDSISFDCATPHAYANHGIEPAVGIWFVVSHFG